jgi:hypothetical protein
MKLLTLLLLGTFLSCPGYSQNSFLIYTVKGNVSVIENNVTTKAKIGRLLPESAQVVLAPGAVVSLICNQANLINLNKGKVSLSTLGEQCKSTESSATSNYLKYVWSQLTAHPGSPEKNRKQFMTNVGAVSRGVNSVWIDPRLDTIKYVSGSFPLSWKSYAEAEEFDFMVFDEPRNSKPVTTVTTKNRYVDAKTIASSMTPTSTLYWTAAVKGEQNPETKVFQYVPTEVYKNVLASFEQSGPELETEAAKAFRVAFLLEQAHYLAEAYTYYKKATTLEPASSIYKSTLDSFKKDYAVK